MNFFHKTLSILAVVATISLSAMAQDNSSVLDLVKQGVQLNEQGNYAGAIEKYNEALKIDPDNAQASYEMAFSLFASGKGNEAVSYVEKAIKVSGNLSLTAACYDLLGSIYDQDHKSDQAIEVYKKGIAVNPKYQRLYYNLGIAQFRNKQFGEAEASAIEAIKLDPKHASSQRMYALVTFHQNKRVNALMGFCNFLILEPQSPRSAEAYNNIQHILQGGVIKDASGRNTIILSPKGDQENETSNLSISMAVLSAQKNKLSGMDQLEYEFKHIFMIAGELTEKKTDKSFFEKFYIDYFYKLAQTNNMPAFTRMISASANNDEYSKWMGNNGQLVKELNNWIMTTPRDF